MKRVHYCLSFVIYPVLAIISVAFMIAGMVYFSWPPFNHINYNVEVAKCYKLISSDPFRTEPIIIKVTNIKSGYFQYRYINSKGLYSDRLMYSNAWSEVPCPEE